MLSFKQWKLLQEKTLDQVLQYKPNTIPSDLAKQFFTELGDKYNKFVLPILKLRTKDNFEPDDIKLLLDKIPKGVDINKINNIKELQDIINKYQEEKNVTIKDKDFPLVFKNSKWQVYEVKSWDAAKKYTPRYINQDEDQGLDYGWCTGDPNKSHFCDSYLRQGKVYVFFRGKPVRKDVYGQLYFSKSGNSEFQLPHNKKVDLDEFYNKNKDLQVFLVSIGYKVFIGYKFNGRKFEYELENDMLVFDDINISDIGLKSLQELPWVQEGKQYKVTGHFNCSHNILTSLEGSPNSVGGHFSCSHNILASLEGSPNSVGGHFGCSHNILATLNGSPISVRGNFICSFNKLTSLKGSPSSVGGSFSCSHNILASLEGSPSSVGGDFDCSNNQLTTLEGSPKTVDGYFNCSKQKNKKEFTEEEVREVSDVKGNIYV